MAERPDSVQEYTDYVLLGKTGMGKSTTGNKLLGFDENNDRGSYKFMQHASRIPGLLKIKHALDQGRSAINSLRNARQQATSVAGTDLDLDNPRKEIVVEPFEESVQGNKDSTTEICELKSNETLKIRVLDVPGFADSKQKKGAASRGELGTGSSVYKNNLALIRQLVHIQIDKDLKIKYILYFLPERGVPEKASGYLQEEIEVMYYFFGMKVFKHMVIIGTLSSLPWVQHASNPFEQEAAVDYLKGVFLTAVKTVVGDNFTKDFECPPIVYIDIKDNGVEIRKKLDQARPDKQDHMQFEIRNNVCSKCASKLIYIEGSNECVSVWESSEGIQTSTDKSTCHPEFTPKYSIIKKMVTNRRKSKAATPITTFFAIPVQVQRAPLLDLLIPSQISFVLDIQEYIAAKVVKKIFEEECINCRGKPGSPGCLPVRQAHKFTYKDKQEFQVYVDHSSNVAKFEFKAIED